MAENEVKTETKVEVESEAVKTNNEEPKVDFEAELKRLKAENEKLKAAQSNACSDAAEWKRKFRATQSEQERMQAEQAEELAKLTAQNNEYKLRERTLSYQSKLMESGYDASTAQTMANALPEGIGDDFFAEQKRFFEQVKTKAKEEALNQQPDITSGKTPSAQDVKDRDAELFRKAALGI